MPNVVKFFNGAQTSGLRKGACWIGVGDVDKGPTSTTGYWNGITPPAGGYTIYINKGPADGPAVYVAANDAELIAYTAMISGTTYASAALALNYYMGFGTRFVLDRDYETISTTNLIWSVDAAHCHSYPRTGTVVYDMGSDAVYQYLTNGPAFVSAGAASYFSFDGTNDFLTSASYNAAYNTNGTQPYTAEVWFYATASSTTAYYPIFSNYSVISGYNAGWGMWYTQNPASVGAGNVMLYGERFGGGSAGTGPISAYASETIPTGSFYNTWHQAVSVYDGTNIMFYRNGVLKQTNPSTYSISNTVALVQLAARPNTSSPVGFTPIRVNVARLYNRALTSAEILQNFNAQRGRLGI
jgi:hypothetical protein